MSETKETNKEISPEVSRLALPQLEVGALPALVRIDLFSWKEKNKMKRKKEARGEKAH